MRGSDLFLAGVLALTATAASAAAEAQQPHVANTPYSIERTLVTELAAADGYRYRLLISWPEGDPPAGGWPVLYVLDGGDQFAIFTEVARRLGRAGPRSKVGGGIVVGIDSGPLARRVLDYTPPAPGYVIPAGAPASGLATGGSEAFLDFLDRGVKPFVARRWRTDPARQTLAGHSFGGLLALHALYTRPAIASRFAAVSPSLWFGQAMLAREVQAARPAGKQVLVAEGGAGPADASPAEAVAARLRAAGADARFLPLTGQTHGTTMLAATGQIVTLAFANPPASP